jgi:hypothetical protein
MVLVWKLVFVSVWNCLFPSNWLVATPGGRCGHKSWHQSPSSLVVCLNLGQRWKLSTKPVSCAVLVSVEFAIYLIE